MNEQAMTKQQAIQQAADSLWDATQRIGTVPFVRELIGDSDVESAYEIQRRVVARKLEQGRTRVGRKVGLTNPAVQKQAGVDEPDYGTILDDMVFASGHVFDTADYVHPKIEAEVCFILGKDLDTWDRQSIEGAIEAFAPAFELVDNHYVDYKMKIVDTIADNAACAGIIMGERTRYTGQDLRDTRLSLTRDGEEITSGVGSNVMGDPLNAIAWLARTAAEQGEPLRAGEILLPGSIGMIMWWDAGPTYRADISGVGSVTARFEETKQ